MREISPLRILTPALSLGEREKASGVVESVTASDAISALGLVSGWMCSAGAPNTAREGACAPHFENE